MALAFHPEDRFTRYYNTVSPVITSLFRQNLEVYFATFGKSVSPLFSVANTPGCQVIGLQVW